MPTGEGGRTVHVVRITAREPCADCIEIRFLFLSNGQKIDPDMAHRMLVAGGVIRCGSETGPSLQPAIRGTVRFVRTRPGDSSEDALLHLPRAA